MTRAGSKRCVRAGVGVIGFSFWWFVCVCVMCVVEAEIWAGWSKVDECWVGAFAARPTGMEKEESERLKVGFSGMMIESSECYMRIEYYISLRRR